MPLQCGGVTSHYSSKKLARVRIGPLPYVLPAGRTGAHTMKISPTNALSFFKHMDDAKMYLTHTCERGKPYIKRLATGPWRSSARRQDVS